MNSLKNTKYLCDQKLGDQNLCDQNLGDQILEFNGHSLIDSTYEEVRTLQNYSGDYVQLVVQHNNSRFRTNNSLEISRHYQTVPRLCQSSSRRRRNLPLLPICHTVTHYLQSNLNYLNVLISEYNKECEHKQ